ncbi:hypothetical protein GOODEAATRI_002858 [Goodea atripinnis]|uniref:Uncharacterized protein n=1 Tax=Goodea atripinnis TaxID=208336 RepID=A0ABV0NRA4_9TELE
MWENLSTGQLLVITSVIKKVIIESICKQSWGHSKHVLWSDETKIYLFGQHSNHCVFWKTITACYPEQTIHTVTNGDGCIMLWGQVSWLEMRGGRMELNPGRKPVRGCKIATLIIQPEQ